MSAGKHIGRPVHTKARGVPCPICGEDIRVSIYTREGRKKLTTHMQETCGSMKCRGILSNQRRKETMSFLVEAS